MGTIDTLVTDILHGQKGAATRLYRALAPALMRYLERKLPSHESAEEVCQDVFLSALDSLALYRGDSSLKTWILSIARHEVADYYRKRYVRQVVEKTSPLFESIMADIHTPEFDMKKTRIRERFGAAYASLSVPHKDVLSYRFELGMSVKEIAIRMELPFKATESLLYRARKAFIAAYSSSAPDRATGGQGDKHERG